MDESARLANSQVSLVETGIAWSTQPSQLEKSPESKANPLRTRLPLCHLGLATRVGREAADVTKTADHEAFL